MKQAISANANLVLGLLNRSVDNIPEKRQALVEYLQRMDRVRKIDVRDYVPELHKFLTEQGYAR